MDYFGQRAYLAQSPQFYKQIMVGVFERVFEVGPVFRAEPHDTVRHINEYVSLDVELGFIRDHRDVMAVLTAVVRGILAHLHTACAADLAALDVKMPAAPDPFPVLYFPEAQELILQRWGEDCRGEPDLAPQHERWLGQWAQEQFGSDFLFVTGYPMAKRPFYTHPNPADPAYSNSFDLLFRGTELVTGGQRLHLYQDYLDSAAARGLHQPGAVRDLLRGVQVRHAAPRRFRHRPGTLHHAVARPGQRPPGDAVPAGLEPADAVKQGCRIGDRSQESGVRRQESGVRRQIDRCIPWHLIPGT